MAKTTSAITSEREENEISIRNYTGKRKRYILKFVFMRGRFLGPLYLCTLSQNFKLLVSFIKTIFTGTDWEHWG